MKHRTQLLSKIALGGVLFAAVGVLTAQNSSRTPTGPIASVDVVVLFNEYQRQKDLTEELRQKQDELQQVSAEKRARLDSMQATLDAMDPADPTYMNKTRELRSETISYKVWSEIVQADMEREVAIWTVRVYQEILAAIKEVAEAQGIDAVFYRENFEAASFDPEVIRGQIRNRKVLYASQATDLTSTLLDNLNRAYRAQPQKPMLQITP